MSTLYRKGPIHCIFSTELSVLGLYDKLSIEEMQLVSRSDSDLLRCSLGLTHSLPLCSLSDAALSTPTGLGWV